MIIRYHIRFVRFLAFFTALSAFSALHVGATELGIQESLFTIDGEPTFLLGISYYGALGASKDSIQKDLDDVQEYRFNWIRVWATWGAFDNDVTVVNDRGLAREPFISKLQWLIEECDRRGIIVDVTISRGNHVVGPPRLQTLDVHRRAVETIVTKLKPYRNWYFDLSNERNILDDRFTSIEELRELQETVHRLDPQRLVSASRSGNITRKELRDEILKAKLDFITPHRSREKNTHQETEPKTREWIAWMEQIGHSVPIHFQEPFRSGYGKAAHGPEDFLIDLEGAFRGGAAGWCFHNGDSRGKPERKPRRSFDMREQRLFEQLDSEDRKVLDGIRQMALEKILRD